MDKKKGKLLTSIIVPTVGAVAITLPTEVDATLFSKFLSEANQNTPNTQTNPSDEVLIVDGELARVLKEKIGVGYNEEITQAHMESLTTLEITHEDSISIKSLRGLEAATNLTSLTIRGQEINDVSPVSQLTGLISLDLSENPITVLGDLSGLTQLEDLNLSMGRLEDINGLKNLTQLKRVDLSGNIIKDASAVEGLLRLESLDLSNNMITDIPNMENYTGLKNLNLRLNEISDFSVLSNFTSLEVLNISDTPVATLEVVSGLTQLSELSFDNTSVESVEILKDLPSLNYVSGNGTKVYDLRPLKNVSTISFQNIELKSSIELASNYLKVPVYDKDGEFVPVVLCSYGEWDEQAQALKINTTPSDGDIVDIAFANADNSISGNIQLTTTVKKSLPPIILVDQTTGKVQIKNIENGSVVYYREKQDGEWKQYAGEFIATPYATANGINQYYIEAKQTNFITESESAVNEFESLAKLSQVIYNYQWWSAGSATISLNHEDSDVKIMYRFLGENWREYSGQLDISSVHRSGKIEMEFYAVKGSIQSDVTSFSILKAPTVEGIRGSNKIQLVHPLPKVNLYYRLNGGQWIKYSQPFEINTAGEYTIETYAEEAGVESPISIPVVVTSTVDSEINDNTVNNNGGNENNNQNNENNNPTNNQTGNNQTGNNSNDGSSTENNNQNGTSQESSKPNYNAGETLQTGVVGLPVLLTGVFSILGGALLFFRKK